MILKVFFGEAALRFCCSNHIKVDQDANGIARAIEQTLKDSADGFDDIRNGFTGKSLTEIKTDTNSGFVLELEISPEMVEGLRNVSLEYFPGEDLPADVHTYLQDALKRDVARARNYDYRDPSYIIAVSSPQTHNEPVLLIT